MHLGAKYLVLYLAVSAHSLAAANNLPRACSGTLGGPLASTDAGVHTDHSGFVDDPNGNSISFEVYSLANMAANVSYYHDPEKVDMCFRYEIRNISNSHTIDSFFWPDIGLPYYGYEIRPGGQPPGWPRKASDVLQTPGVYSTTVHMFRDARPVTVTALFPVEKRRKVLGSQKKINYLIPSALSSDLLTTLVAFDLEVAPVPGVTLPPSSDVTYATLSYDFMPTTNLSIVATSELSFEESKFKITYTITNSGNLAFAAPLMRTLQELYPDPTEGDAIEFAKSVDAFLGSSANAEDLIFETYIDPAVSEFGEFAVFVVQHPVTVRSEGGEACMMQEAYSPVPIHIPARKCDLPEDVIAKFRQQQ